MAGPWERRRQTVCWYLGVMEFWPARWSERLYVLAGWPVLALGMAGLLAATVILLKRAMQ